MFFGWLIKYLKTSKKNPFEGLGTGFLIQSLLEALNNHILLVNLSKRWDFINIRNSCYGKDMAQPDSSYECHREADFVADVLLIKQLATLHSGPFLTILL